MSKILIVGGVAGGASAAARLRRLDEKSEIIMFRITSYNVCYTKLLREEYLLQ